MHVSEARADSHLKHVVVKWQTEVLDDGGRKRRERTLLETCFKRVRQEMLLRLDETGQAHQALESKVTSNASNNVDLSGEGTRDGPHRWMWTM